MNHTLFPDWLRRPIPLMFVVLVAAALHGPLLMMQLPSNSFDTNFHIFFADHYAKHWFHPWNEKWYAGFSQTTYPPLGHQWIALLSNVLGLNMAYMAVQFIAVLLLAVGMYRFARLWVDERAASYAAVASSFLGTLVFLVYYSGQLSTTLSFPLYLNALPYFYDWMVRARGRALLKGLALTFTAASVHHVTLLFGAALFSLPVLWLAWMDRERAGASGGGVLSRAVVFAGLTAVGVAVVLWPYFMALLQNPIKQIPIPHASRDNYLLNLLSLLNYFVVPYGALLLAMPFVVIRAAKDRRLVPLLLGFWVTFLIALGGTTPFPRWIFQRAFEILTFERFTLWTACLMLPIVGLLISDLIDRFQRKAVVGVALAAILTFGLGLYWLRFTPQNPGKELNVDEVIAFLNRDGHDQYRYITLGFGNALPKVSTYANAGSVDGEYNSGRLLPELTAYGSAQLTSSKYYGTQGMGALRAILKHANHYGLKYIFVHDPYYEPLLAFAGWRKFQTFDYGRISGWAKDDVPPARRIESNAVPPPWAGLMWGILPMACSLAAILLVFLLPDRKRLSEPIEFPAVTPEPTYAREAR